MKTNLTIFAGKRDFYVGPFECQRVKTEYKNPHGYACENPELIIKLTAVKDDFSMEKLKEVMQYGLTVLFENTETKDAVVKEILSPTSFTLQFKS